MRAYLDSSAIVKRYIKETGSESIDVIYNALEQESQLEGLTFSSWNFGEVFGAIDTRYQRRDITEEAMRESLLLFSQETKKFVAMRKVNVLPIGAKILAKTRELILKYHIYQADALQLSSAIQARAELFVSADKKLVECGKTEQLKVLNPERDHDLIEAAVTKKEEEE